MKKLTLQSIIAATFSLLALEGTQAAKKGMEKCQLIGFDKEGKEVGLIKEGMTDCHSMSTTCSGSNKIGDKEAWLYLPEGICEKIEGGTVVKKEKK